MGALRTRSNHGVYTAQGGVNASKGCITTTTHIYTINILCQSEVYPFDVAAATIWMYDRPEQWYNLDHSIVEVTSMHEIPVHRPHRLYGFQLVVAAKARPPRECNER